MKEETKQRIEEMVRYILPHPDCEDELIVDNHTSTIERIFEEDKNWFEKLPLWSRYILHFIVGLLLGIIIML